MAKPKSSSTTTKSVSSEEVAEFLEQLSSSATTDSKKKVTKNVEVDQTIDEEEPATTTTSSEPTTTTKPKKKSSKHDPSSTSTVSEADKSRSSLFVRGLPYDATGADLEAFFSEIGPVRQCFVVGDTSTTSATTEGEASVTDGSKKNKGYGFVHFAIAEDAVKAIEELKEVKFMGKRPLLMEIALKKKGMKERAEERKNAGTTEEVKEKEGGADEAKTTKKEPKSSKPPVIHKPSKPFVPKVTGSKVVILTGLPEGLNSKQLNHKVRKMGSVVDLVFPVPGSDDPNVAHVTYSSHEEANAAITKLDKHIFKGSTITATLKEKSTISTKPRLIIRNLAFTATEDDLRKIFSKHGTVVDVSIPSKPSPNDGTKTTPLRRGFAFVTMGSMEEANVAVEKGNGVKIRGREVAVDFALPKGVYESGKGDEEQAVEEGEGQGEGESCEPEAEEDNGDDVQEMEVDGEDINEDGGNDENGLDGDEAEIEGDDEEEDGDVDLNDGGDEDEDEDEDELDDGVEVVYEDEIAEDGIDADTDGDVDGEEAADEADDEAEKDTNKKKKNKKETKDGDALKANVREGCTLFIRNLSFETTQEALTERFKSFGMLRYARITKDPATGRSRGTGFVCYFNQKDADKCMAAYASAEKAHALLESSSATATDSNNKKGKPGKGKKEDTSSSKSILVPEPSQTSIHTATFTLDGRFLNVTLAVSKEDAAKLQEENYKVLRSKDKRRMYLIKEGVIFPGTEAAEGISPTELSKRQKSFAERRRLLESNPNLFISRTRLSIRNLHPNVGDKFLRRAGILAVMRFWDEVSARRRKGLEREVIEEEKEEGREVPSKERKILVKNAKVMYDLEKVDKTTNKPRSKGFGFLEFESHADALACLRWMNNNPYAFTTEGAPSGKTELADMKKSKEELKSPGKLRRPIVEFALENRIVLKKREEVRRKEKEKRDYIKEHGNEVAENFAKRDKGKGKKRGRDDDDGDDEGKRVKKGRGDGEGKKKEGDGDGEKKKKGEQWDPETKKRKKEERKEKKAAAKKRKAEAASGDDDDGPRKVAKVGEAAVGGEASMKTTFDVRNETSGGNILKSNKKGNGKDGKPERESRQPKRGVPKPAPKQEKSETPEEIAKKARKGVAVLSKAQKRDADDDSKFRNLLEKYGKGLFGPESKIISDSPKGKDGGESGSFKKWMA
ncbi:RNA recognition motif-containing protein [Blyttiomyces sp. JEL0837]|nr:RNA recognition motif-containing protein [Blyttiomyces sp. JEL0837]